MRVTQPLLMWVTEKSCFSNIFCFPHKLTILKIYAYALPYYVRLCRSSLYNWVCPVADLDFGLGGAFLVQQRCSPRSAWSSAPMDIAMAPPMWTSRQRHEEWGIHLIYSYSFIAVKRSFPVPACRFFVQIYGSNNSSNNCSLLNHPIQTLFVPQEIAKLS